MGVLFAIAASSSESERCGAWEGEAGMFTDSSGLALTMPLSHPARKTTSKPLRTLVREGGGDTKADRLVFKVIQILS